MQEMLDRQAKDLKQHFSEQIDCLPVHTYCFQAFTYRQKHTLISSASVSEREVWTGGLQEPNWRSLWSMGRILTNVNQSYRRSTRPFHSSNFAGCRCSLIPRLSDTTARYEFFEYALFHQSNISNQLSSLACCIVCGRLVLTRNSTGLRTAKQHENSI